MDIRFLTQVQTVASTDRLYVAVDPASESPLDAYIEVGDFATSLLAAVTIETSQITDWSTAWNTAFGTKSTSDLAEGTNLYYTNARVDALIQDGTGISWVYSEPGGTLTPTISLSSFSTTNLAEGTNKYYTDERVDDRVATLIKNGTGITWAYVDGSGTLTPTISLGSFSTANLSENTNLYYTDGRVDSRITGTWRGAANGLAPLGADSKIPSSYLPTIAITSTYVVADQTAQLALSAQEGDVAVRSDESKSYIHNGGVAGTMADWTLLQTPGIPVLSVNGLTGSVSLTTTNITEGTNLYYTDGRADARIAAAIGVSVQAYSSSLATIAGLNSSNNRFIVGTAGGWASQTASTARSSLGLAIGVDVQAYNAALADIAAGTWTGASSINRVGTLAYGSVPWSLLSSVPSSFTPAAHTLDGHSNVTITANSAGELLGWNGSAWINQTLAEWGISAVGHSHNEYAASSEVQLAVVKGFLP